ncbi:hypothetical protein ACT7DI_20815 [Bacillus paranthracis]
MAALKETTYIERNTYNEIGFFKGIVWGLVFVVPFLDMPATVRSKGR